MKELGQKWHLWESFKETNTAHQKETQASLTFAKRNLNDPQNLRGNILWTEETNVEPFGRSCYTWHKTNTALHKKCNIATVEYGDGSVMV